MSHNRKTIRGIDEQVFQQARIYALQTNRTIGELVTESLLFFFEEADDPMWVSAK